MGKLFGTDGIRGVVNDGLDAMLAFRVGMAAAQVMTREKGGGQPRFTIGKDTQNIPVRAGAIPRLCRLWQWA